MKKANISLSCDAEKLLALEQYLAKKDVLLTDELEGYIQRLYEKHVPPILREYIDAKAEQDAQSRTRPTRPRSTPTNEGEI